MYYNSLLKSTYPCCLYRVLSAASSVQGMVCPAQQMPPLCSMLLEAAARAAGAAGTMQGLPIGMLIPA